MHLLIAVLCCDDVAIEDLINQFIWSHGTCAFLKGQVEMEAPLAVPATFDTVIHQSYKTSRNNGAL